MTTSATKREEVDPRAYLAVERTLLAWVRTGLAMMGFGFVVARFGWFLRSLAAAGQEARPGEQGGLSLWFGMTLILLGVAMLLLAGWQHTKAVSRLQRGERLQPTRFSTGVVLAVLLALLGVAMATYLVALD
jgi:putative membrane protein